MAQAEPQHSVGQSTGITPVPSENTHHNKLLKKNKNKIKHNNGAEVWRGCRWQAKKSQEKSSADKTAPRQSPAGEEENHQNFTYQRELC